MGHEGMDDQAKCYENIVKLSSEGIWTLDADNRTDFINENGARMLGYTPEEMSGMDYMEFVLPEDIPAVLHRLDERRKGAMHCFETRLRRRDGSILWAKVTASPFLDGEGRYLGTMALFFDVTQLKGAIEALNRRNAEMSIINSIISIAASADTMERLASHALEEVMRLLDFDLGGIYLVKDGSSQADLIYSKNLTPAMVNAVGRVNINDFPYRQVFIEQQPVYTEDFDALQPGVSKVMGIQSVASIPLISKERVVGSLNVGSVRRVTFRDDEKQLLISIGKELGNTISKMAVEEGVRRSATNFHTLFNSITDLMFILTKDGRIIGLNEAVERKLKYSSDELVGKHILSVHAPERQEEARKVLEKILNGECDLCLQPFVSKDGSIIEVETKVTHGWWNEQECLFGVSRDVTEKRKAEEAIKKLLSEKQFFQDSLEDSTQPFAAGNLERRVIYVNKAMCDLTGYTAEEMRQLSWKDNLTPAHYREFEEEQFKRLFETGVPLKYEKEYVRKDGRLVPVELLVHLFKDASGNPLYYYSFVNDLTERKRVERELQKANRQLGLLASISRHDMNNQLTALSGYATLIGLQEDPAKRSNLSVKMMHSIQGLKDQLEFMQTYYEIGMKAPVWQNLHELVARAASKIELKGMEIREDNTGYSILADPMFEKVVLNLIDNAQRHSGGATMVFVETAIVDGSLKLTFRDNGVGISEQDRSNLFKRGYGKNTGFGLFLSREVVNISGISLDETSKAGQGACFELVVPSGNFMKNGQ